MLIEIKKSQGLHGEVYIPGDKSISHRAIMLGSLAKGTTRITNFLQGADCLSTIDCFRKMGIVIDNHTDEIIVYGKGLHGLNSPKDILDVGNSGTTTRLISGILAGQEFSSTLTGDASIQSRPMGRIMTPLTQMGASLTSLKKKDCAPFTIEGGNLHSIDYCSPVASAQVKSCILFAGMYAKDEGRTRVTEPSLSRNHSELMLSHFGADVQTAGTSVSIAPDPSLSAREVEVPGDISSAAYFIAAGLLVPGSEILVKNVGLNPTRDGLIRVCKAMGGDVTILNSRCDSGEPVGDLLVRHSELTGTVIEGDIIPTLIDELPMIAVMAAFAKGRTVIRNAAELRVKESNRIDVMVENLSAMGVDIMGTEDGMIIDGGHELHGTLIQSYKDHRVAMSMTVAGLAADGVTRIVDGDCVVISYPGFYEDLKSLQK